MLTKMIETLKKNPRTIVFTEGTDNRILDAADKLTAEGILGVILLGTEEEVKAVAKAGNYNIDKCSIIDPAGYPEMDAMVAEMVKLRKGKMTEEQCRKALFQSNYFGTMLVKMGKADCLLGGATYSTADTVRPALQLIKTKPGNKIVSSCFILVRGDEKIAMGDCAINIDPSEDDLVEIAIESAKTARVFGIDPKVAMLSYSTLGSGKGPDVDLVEEATAIVKEKAPDLAVVGSIQFDAAWSPTVAATKAKGNDVAGHVNVFVFPNLCAGNIGYKAVQRSSGAIAVGPVLQGLNRPVNDLSRGALVQDIINTVALTAIEAQ